MLKHLCKISLILIHRIMSFCNILLPNSISKDIINYNDLVYHFNSLAFFNYLTFLIFIGLTFLTLIFLLSSILFTNNLKFKYIFRLIKEINSILYFFFFFLMFFKLLYLQLNYAEIFFSIYKEKSLTVEIYLFTNVISFKIQNSLLSDAVLILAISSGLTCLYILDSKNISKKINNITIFNIFIIATIIMVYTNNFLIMFIGFELLFIPTLYFVYSSGYMSKTDKTIKFLLIWTFFGAFLIFLVLAYLFFQYKTLDYCVLNTINFSETEHMVISTIIFIGFSIKIPLFPFHFWLTKVHVESPAGFSIYLSGFLVKAALYCLYFLNQIFYSYYIQLIFLILVFLGICDASIKIWSQIDLKRVIALATIQEMSLITFTLFSTNIYINPMFIFIILLHGWLSTLMFFIVDIIQKKFKTRHIGDLRGIAFVIPEIRWPVLIVNFLFTGFPGTVKFLMEFYMIVGFSILPHYINVLLVLIIIFVGGSGFSYHIFNILYGQEKKIFKKLYLYFASFNNWKVNYNKLYSNNKFENVRFLRTTQGNIFNESLVKKDKIIIYITSYFLIILNTIIYVCV